ncbi:RAMP superfamily CRISPR-associated protein [bacterium]|nr:RAMP superfamily CRISPR-associated protein [bacterium]
MHKKIINQLELQFDLVPTGPLLIKSGRDAGADPTIPDMNFVRSLHPELGETVYLPGSSLKGLLRAYCERIGRTRKVSDCDPFAGSFCGRRLEKEKSELKCYARSCAICRIFGNTVLASHLAITDAYPASNTAVAANKTEERDGVAIDRFTGGVAVGPFNFEVVVGGLFQTKLLLSNFQFWQVGLLAIALRDIKQGFVPLGFGKSRGLGSITLNFKSLRFVYPFTGKNDDVSAYAWSTGSFESEDITAYDLIKEDKLSLNGLETVVEEPGDYGRIVITVIEKSIEDLLKRCAAYWARYAELKHHKGQ